MATSPKCETPGPSSPRSGENASPPQDQYFKGALFLNTLRSVVDDDKRGGLLRGLHDRFKHKNIMTEDIVQYFNQETGKNLTPIFDQYLRHVAIPILELKFDEAKGMVSYRWKAEEKSFEMPVRVGAKDKWQVIQPTTNWQDMKTALKKDQFEVATSCTTSSSTRRRQGLEQTQTRSASAPSIAVAQDRGRTTPIAQHGVSRRESPQRPADRLLPEC